jgi:hypothetical protein
MSAGTWIRAQRDRPISNSERRTAFTLIALTTAVSALLLTAATPSAPSPHTATRHHAGARLGAPAPAVSAVPGAVEESVAREFLHGYLAYIYGRAQAARVRGATPAFTHALLARARLVPPSMRARRPRVLAVHPAGPHDAKAIINDGGLIDYPLTLQLVHRGDRLLVSGTAGA